MQLIHLNIKLTGLVQGIFFRVTAKDKADKFNLVGFTRNESDGSVYIEVEGEEEKLDEFLEWCKNGPTLARVDKIEIKKGKFKNFSQFQVY